MTDDHDLETILRRYEPAEPSARLRERILDVATAPRSNSTIAWQLAAAAALLLIGAGFQTATARVDERLRIMPTNVARGSEPDGQLNAFYQDPDEIPELSLDDLFEWRLIERLQ